MPGACFLAFYFYAVLPVEFVGNELGYIKIGITK
jgi:hypothetical protein